MTLDKPAILRRLRSFDFPGLFTQELGWDSHRASLAITLGDLQLQLRAVAQKRGMAVFTYDANDNPAAPSPDYALRRKIERQVAKSAHEHLIIFLDAGRTAQIWQWVKRETDKSTACREHAYHVAQSGEALVQKLSHLLITLEEEEHTTLFDVASKTQKGFDIDKVTKRFYERFKAEHTAFLAFIKGFPPPQKKGKDQVPHPDHEWYTSLMLNRLMFVYFIQKKGFLNGDIDYLRNRLKLVEQQKGKDKFQSFYRYFLLRLFHEGLGKAPAERKPDLEALLGKVPYLNGGFFQVHPLEGKYAEIDIPDNAFLTLFDFFDEFHWHLDERACRKDDEINPDVVGYIFEKYINQKQMGAYYTKEDITGYISKNTIIPYIFDAAKERCAIAFKPDSALWRLLREDPDKYIYPAVRHGVIDEKGQVIPLPPEIEAGIDAIPKRAGWNKPAASPYALPTETWREHVARRRRCLEVRETLAAGKVHSINDLITLNLDILQFARDSIINSEGPELLRAFWEAIQKITILDPTCGSGAFLFAALHIMEKLYADCLQRMALFVSEKPGKFADFQRILAQIDKHPNERYFIFKSLIIKNLFGVDIMEEAVEICKLRLFLKLVAQVETFDEIEPLPDVDFNVRCGNTLVGFTSIEEVKAAGDAKFGLGFVRDEVLEIERHAQTVEALFGDFRRVQLGEGESQLTSAQIAQTKATLNQVKQALADKLDRYLAGLYGIDADSPKNAERFAKWRTSHQPFHWVTEFYAIVHGGGFSVVIGNPPYVEYGEVLSTYSLIGYRTQTCGNLYAFSWERSLLLSDQRAKLGLIVPIASVCTDGYAPLQQLLRESGTAIISSFNDRPSKLFDGLEHIRLAIILEYKQQEKRIYTTTYNKWQSTERATLFERLSFVETTRSARPGCLAKLGSLTEVGMVEKISLDKGNLAKREMPNGKHRIYYTRKLSHFVQIVDFIPGIKDNRGHSREPTELKEICFETEHDRNVFLSLLNSGLFSWQLTVFSDCRNLNRREIESASLDLVRAERHVQQSLSALSQRLMDDIKAHSRYMTMKYKKLGTLSIQCTYPKESKSIIDEIDRVLAKHYGFTDEELDFIINYDIKYRMGGQDDEDAANDADPKALDSPLPKV